MGLMWLIVGVLTGLSSWVLYVLNKKYWINWLGWTGLISGIFLILFGISWSVSSVLEGVPRSGILGVIMFEGVGLVTLLLTWRLKLQSN